MKMKKMKRKMFYVKRNYKRKKVDEKAIEKTNKKNKKENEDIDNNNNIKENKKYKKDIKEKPEEPEDFDEKKNIQNTPKKRRKRSKSPITEELELSEKPKRGRKEIGKRKWDKVYKWESKFSL